MLRSRESRPGRKLDQTATLFINSFAGLSAWIDFVVIWVTRFGVPALVATVVLQWWGPGDRARVRNACARAGLSFALGLAFNQAVLLFIHRPRPYVAGLTRLIVEPTADWSLPSDHATAAFAIAAAFALCGLRWRAAAYGVAAMFVGLSRVYVGTHYVGDVMAGALTAIAAAGLVTAFYRRGSPLDRRITAIL